MDKKIVVSRNKIIHKIAVPANRRGPNYRYDHYIIAECGTKVGFFYKGKGRKCQKGCFK